MGRAWYFTVSSWEAEHFILHQTEHVPAFLREAEKLKERGELRCIIRDVEGCYPNMPKEAIRRGLKDIADEVAQARDVQGVWVPKRKLSQPCRWKAPQRKSKRNDDINGSINPVRHNGEYTFLPFETMYEVMEFALDNALIEIRPRGSCTSNARASQWEIQSRRR